MFKAIVTAVILGLAPGLALAQSCPFGHDEERVLSCADGTMWDTNSGTCVAIVTG